MLKIGLIGNPNCGKSTLFNQLTGLNQKTGNFAGVTIERKSGFFHLSDNQEVELIDYPGTYSIYPYSYDEKVVYDELLNAKFESQPDLYLAIVDASNLNRNLLLFSQLYDLGLPLVLVLNMMDVAEYKGFTFDIPKLKSYLPNVDIIKINAKNGENISELKQIILQKINHKNVKNSSFSFYEMSTETTLICEELKSVLNLKNNYQSLVLLNESNNTSLGLSVYQSDLENIKSKHNFDCVRSKSHETISRYKKINEILNKCVQKTTQKNIITKKIDQFLLHPYFGFAFLIAVFFLVFQAIFSWALLPMDGIDFLFYAINGFIKNNFSESKWLDFLTDGLLAGIGGVLIFAPQIAILFFFIALLEESGYMARVIFLMDSLMKKFGLNGRSIVPLFSSAACAIPAMMSARNISHKKERLITIFIAPLISCSARIPVYTIIISLVIPHKYFIGFIDYQAVAMLSMYALGFITALISAFVLSKILKSDEKSFLILEMPDYKVPKIKNILVIMKQKVWSFISESGKIIIAISLILWILSNFGYSNNIENAEKNIIAKYETGEEKNIAEIDAKISSAKLEASYAGSFGKFIEPIIKPLGFDWKIGIAILTSFAAREVFVGTISTIYTIENQDDNQSIIEKLKSVKDNNGNLFFNFARGMSLLVFYAFALQCMSTIAVSKKETGNWKIPLLQFIYFGFLAYFSSYLVYKALCM
ncbi:MAG: ferrous iron transport protein B [Bacteroidetes bacterium]|nr:MAG: ferrous iron transport protein B [Bacteroidota bacterium]